MPILCYRDHRPQIAKEVFIAPNAYVVGDVTIGEQSSVWFGTTVRGDVFPIRIGARVNLQDHVVVHVTTGLHPAIVEDDVTVGHAAVLHGCTVSSGCLIGMGAIILDRAVIGSGSLIAAGSLVTEGTRIPEGVLAVGRPAKPKRELTEEERQILATSPMHYATLAAEYRATLDV